MSDISCPIAVIKYHGKSNVGKRGLIVAQFQVIIHLCSEVTETRAPDNLSCFFHYEEAELRKGMVVPSLLSYKLASSA